MRTMLPDALHNGYRVLTISPGPFPPGCPKERRPAVEDPEGREDRREQDPCYAEDGISSPKIGSPVTPTCRGRSVIRRHGGPFFTDENLSANIPMIVGGKTGRHPCPRNLEKKPSTLCPISHWCVPLNRSLLARVVSWAEYNASRGRGAPRAAASLSGRIPWEI